MNHIKYEEGLSHCGAVLDENTFYFKEIEQVLINNLHGERIACEFCRQSIIRDLMTTPRKLTHGVYGVFSTPEELTEPSRNGNLTVYGEII
jgi:hypothetical protein